MDETVHKNGIQPDDDRRTVLLHLYSAERAEQQTAIQQTLATVAAAGVYGGIVGNKLLSNKCHPGDGCEGVPEVALLLAPLPALALLGFLNNQALIELRDRYIQSLETELATLTPPGDGPAEKFPSFVGRAVPKVYGPGEPWYRIVTGVIWGLIAWVIAAALTVGSMRLADSGWGRYVACVAYLVVGSALTLAGLETLWLNRGATPRSPLSWLPRRMTRKWRAHPFSPEDAPPGWGEQRMAERQHASQHPRRDEPTHHREHEAPP